MSALGPAELWENIGPERHWLEVKLSGVRANGDGIGARLRIAGQRRRRTRVNAVDRVLEVRQP